MRLSLATVSSLTDSEIDQLFMRARWGEAPICPSCGCSTLYRLETRRVWKCRDCKKQFSVTSGSCLASRKLPPRTILVAILLFVSGAKGIASLQLQRMLGVQYHTAYIFTQKIREALLAEQEALPKLEGEVEVDGAFFGGHIERFNFRDRRTGHIHCRRRYGERRVVVVARQRGGRTLTTVVAKESEAFPFIVERVAAASTIHADLGHGWDGLQRLYEMMRIGHHEGFSLRGAYTNQAESFFAMLRRKQMGVHHRMSGEHLRLYAAEMAWRMDHKHLSGSELAILVLRLLLTQAPTGQFVNFFSNTRLPA